MMSRYDPLRPTDAELHRIYLVRRLVAEKKPRRAVRLAASLSDPVERMTALGWAMSIRTPRRASEHFRGALARDPTAQSALFGLLRIRRRAVEANDPSYRDLAAPLEGPAAAVVSGWRHAADNDWPALRLLESTLAAAEPLDPSYGDAMRLRVRWRAASNDPALREEAVEIAREILRARPLAEDVVLGAQAFSAADRPTEALQLLDFLSRSPRDRESVRAGLALLDALPPKVDGTERAAVRQRLARPANQPPSAPGTLEAPRG